MMKLQNPSQKSSTLSSHNKSGTNDNPSWYDETDSGYSHELARRSVARAALNLGIEHMSGDALDGLGDVLIQYLERMGQSMAAITEAGNRSSAHCNILDAIDAMEMNMIPLQKNNQESNTPLGWNDLACFAFGHQWKDKVIDFDTGIIQSESMLQNQKEALEQQQRLEQETKIAAAKAAAVANSNTTINGTTSLTTTTTAATATPSVGPTPNNPLNNNPNPPPALVGHKKNGDKLRNLTQKNPRLANSLLQQTTPNSNTHPSNNPPNTQTTESNSNGNSTQHDKDKNSPENENHPSPKSNDLEEEEGAWNAPYLDVVPMYPLLQESSLPMGARLLATEDEACRGDKDGLPGWNSERDVTCLGESAAQRIGWDLDQIPSRNFFAHHDLNAENGGGEDGSSGNATTSNTKKRARFDPPFEETDGPSAKRQKSSSDKSSSSISHGNSYRPSPPTRPSYVPVFLPVFPPKHTYQPIIIRNSSQISSFHSHKKFQNASSTQGHVSIRRSLVHQQHQQQRTHTLERHPDPSLTVPNGNSSNVDPMEDTKKKESNRSSSGNTGNNSSITPLEKISVSRISKILEGSMDLQH